MTSENSNRRRGGWLSPLVHLSNNWISLAGVVIVTSATVFWLFLLPTTLGTHPENPYLGILAFLTIPVPFFGGLLLIPLGIWLKRRRERRAGVSRESSPPLVWSNPELRKLVYFVGVTTVLNLVIASQLTYGAVSYMDSVTFCGQTCHTVMQPEFVAYQNSPHSRVECVKCHIGPGAGWFVKSKLSGVRQVFAVAFNTHPRPIPTPVHDLRPARETCEACHWPQKYGEDRVRVVTKFAEDETNTRTKSVLLMKIGGGNHGIGIHGTHLGPGIVIRYRHSDESRQSIPWIEYEVNGKRKVYLAEGAKPDGAGLTLREMDCMDCHNRPSHTFELPGRALDRAMANGQISPSLPFAKKNALEVLKANYATQQEAEARIPAAFAKFYAGSGKEAEAAAAAKHVLEIYGSNVFPEMKVTWAQYPNNIGHTDFPGCFRCHDDAHKAGDGKAISQDCSACHNVLAMDEPEPKVITELGITEVAGRQPR